MVSGRGQKVRGSFMYKTNSFGKNSSTEENKVNEKIE